MGKKKTTLRVDEDMYREFIEYCEGKNLEKQIRWEKMRLAFHQIMYALLIFSAGITVCLGGIIMSFLDEPLGVFVFLIGLGFIVPIVAVWIDTKEQYLKDIAKLKGG